VELLAGDVEEFTPFVLIGGLISALGNFFLDAVRLGRRAVDEL
jgi:hypothetical protein